jgi:hypothetical protein
MALDLMELIELLERHWAHWAGLVGVHRTIHYNESHSHRWAMSWWSSGREEEKGVQASFAYPLSYFYYLKLAYVCVHKHTHTHSLLEEE